jgi:hypothetical protein
MMVVIMIVIMVMVMVVMIMVMMVMIIVIVVMIVIIVIVVVRVMMDVGGHDTCQANGVMWMVVAVTAAIVSRGRSREECNCADTRYRGSSENEGITGHV